MNVHEEERGEDAAAEHGDGAERARQELADEQHVTPHGRQEGVVEVPLDHLAAHQAHHDPEAAEEYGEADVERLDHHGQDQGLLVEVAALIVDRVQEDDDRRSEGEDHQPEAAPGGEPPAQLVAHDGEKLPAPDAHTPSVSEPIRYW
jgi:hypothetical protein